MLKYVNTYCTNGVMYVFMYVCIVYVCMGTFKGARGREEGNRRRSHRLREL